MAQLRLQSGLLDFFRKYGRHKGFDLIIYLYVLQFVDNNLPHSFYTKVIDKQLKTEQFLFFWCLLKKLWLKQENLQQSRKTFDFMLLARKKHMYLLCVSPALTLTLPTFRSLFLSQVLQGMMVCTLSHTFSHRGDASQRILSNISSPKSLSRVIRKVKVLLPEIFSLLVEIFKTVIERDKVRRELITLQKAVVAAQTRAGQQMRFPLLALFSLRRFDTQNMKDNTVVREYCLV